MGGVEIRKKERKKYNIKTSKKDEITLFYFLDSMEDKEKMENV